jgi:toxin ParE1/3/4
LVQCNGPTRTIDEIAQYSAQNNLLSKNCAKTRKSLPASRHGADRTSAWTRELVVHKNYLIIYRVRADDVEILRIHHVDRKP